jgi:hypothetical protein
MKRLREGSIPFQEQFDPLEHRVRPSPGRQSTALCEPIAGGVEPRLVRLAPRLDHHRSWEVIRPSPLFMLRCYRTPDFDVVRSLTIPSRGPSPIRAKTYGSVLSAMLRVRPTGAGMLVLPSRSHLDAVFRAMSTPRIGHRFIARNTAARLYPPGGPEEAVSEVALLNADSVRRALQRDCVGLEG